MTDAKGAGHMTLIIDAGHGGRWPQGDPGVVAKDGVRLESGYTYLYANALVDFLNKRGFNAVPTRVQDITKTPLGQRTRMAGKDDLFISIHFDAATGSRMIYYSKHPDSRKFAEDVDIFFGSGKLLPSSASRFGGLYIDDAKCPAILIEVDRIDDARDAPDYIEKVCSMIEKGIRRFTKNEMPFSRVFLVLPGETRELKVEKASIVGDKLYIKTEI